jgi:predicted ATPase
LAAAVETIRGIGAGDDMDAAVADAFPGARVVVTGADGYLEVEMRQHGLLRPLKASELSDGTLRYLLLVAALLSPRPPTLMILNEPETSLHPDLLPPLARLIAQASKRSQVIVVSHAQTLVAALGAADDSSEIVLEKDLGETVVRDGTPPNWTWPSR